MMFFMEFNFKDNLRDELNYQGISLKELSAKTNISKRTLENYLGSKNTIPPLDYACKIARALNVSVEMLALGKPFSSEQPELSANIKSLINDFQKLNKENQDFLLKMIHAAAM